MNTQYRFTFENRTAHYFSARRYIGSVEPTMLLVLYFRKFSLSCRGCSETKTRTYLQIPPQQCTIFIQKVDGGIYIIPSWHLVPLMEQTSPAEPCFTHP